ncbi:MAG: hypothetical protein H6708_09475 [Kofleriaceae bacterium]|nr:hypothetical protein [Kofleriaceae bacterium]
MRSSFVVVSLSLLSATACTVKVPGLSMPGRSSSAAAAPAAPGSTDAPTPAPAAEHRPDAPPSTPVGDLAPYYASLQLDALYHLINDERQDEIYERAKADVGRDLLWQSPNPDPTWILSWRTSDWTNASENAEAMTQAAFNRAWEASCVAEAAAARAIHADLAAAYGPELARVDGLTNYYERMAGYAELSARFEADAAAAGLPIDQDPSGPVGFRVTILRHAVAFHAQSRHAWAGFPWAKFPVADRVRRDDGGRELTDDDDFERARYCAAVSRRGGVRTPAFTSIWSEGHMSAKRVAWPTVTGDERADRARAEALVRDAQAGLATAPAVRVEAVEKLYGVSAPDAEPKLARFRDYTVAAVDGATVKVTRTDEDTYSYACRTTNRFDHFDDNGHAVYQERCKSGRRTFRVDAEVTFDELPPGVTLAVGDVVTFAADVERDRNKQTKKSASRQAYVRTMTLTGRQLDGVRRGKTELSW